MRTDGTTVALAAGMLVAMVMHGAFIASVFLLLLVTWWAIPVHMVSVWFAGNIARNRGRNPNIGHALGMWLGVIGVIVALGLSNRGDDETQQSLSLAVVIGVTIAGSVVVAVGWWIIAAILGAAGSA